MSLPREIEAESFSCAIETRVARSTYVLVSARMSTAEHVDKFIAALQTLRPVLLEAATKAIEPE
jgi:hypothetical protein